MGQMVDFTMEREGLVKPGDRVELEGRQGQHHVRYDVLLYHQGRHSHVQQSETAAHKACRHCAQGRTAGIHLHGDCGDRRRIKIKKIFTERGEAKW